MSKLAIYDMKGAEIGSHDVSQNLIPKHRGQQALHEVILAYQAARRAGTASTKTKGEVAGSNKKPWKQKGTGRARAGYRQSPVWRGGGAAFGPHPRSYAVKVNRKVGRLAFQRALSERLETGAIKVVDTIAAESPKTKLFVDLLAALNVKGPALIVVDKYDLNVDLSVRNIPRVEVLAADDVHPYHLVRYPVIIASKAGMAILEQRLKGEGKVAA
ncbi:MAG: 50S ribosomal protein L4 [Verrucomicrobia bacterium]|nr:50S ribosomal protein L4 [Verrucomicrobiota bacterium]